MPAPDGELALGLARSHEAVNVSQLRGTDADGNDIALLILHVANDRFGMLVDAPPMELEVDFDVDVNFVKERKFRRLGDISPVVRTLAQEQFDNYVKRVRIFAHPRIAAAVRSSSLRLADVLGAAIEGR